MPDGSAFSSRLVRPKAEKAERQSKIVLEMGDDANVTDQTASAAQLQAQDGNSTDNAPKVVEITAANTSMESTVENSKSLTENQAATKLQMLSSLDGCSAQEASLREQEAATL